MRPARELEWIVNSDLQAALDASGFVGTWENNLLDDAVHVSGSLIGLLGIDRDAANVGVPLSTLLDGVHCEDQQRVAHLIHAAHQSVGRFDAQFRTVGANGAVRWVSARGQVEADALGRGVRCIGMAVDITEARAASNGDEGELIDAISHLVDTLLAVRGPILRHGTPTLKALINMLLLEIGRELAKHQIIADKDSLLGVYH